MNVLVAMTIHPMETFISLNEVLRMKTLFKYFDLYHDFEWIVANKPILSISATSAFTIIDRISFNFFYLLCLENNTLLICFLFEIIYCCLNNESEINSTKTMY